MSSNNINLSYINDAAVNQLSSLVSSSVSTGAQGGLTPYIASQPYPFNIYTPLTRPADTTAYAAGDWISTNTSSGNGFICAFTSENSIYNVQFRYINVEYISVVVDSATAISTMGGFRLWFFSNATPLTFNDNSPVDITYNTLASSGRGYVELQAPVDRGSTLITPPASAPIVLSNATSLYVGLETLSAFTPTASLRFALHFMGHKL